jgi:hypothetical protein
MLDTLAILAALLGQLGQGRVGPCLAQRGP